MLKTFDGIHRIQTNPTRFRPFLIFVFNAHENYRTYIGSRKAVHAQRLGPKVSARRHDSTSRLQPKALRRRRHFQQRVYFRTQCTRIRVSDPGNRVASLVRNVLCWLSAKMAVVWIWCIKHLLIWFRKWKAYFQPDFISLGKICQDGVLTGLSVIC